MLPLYNKGKQSNTQKVVIQAIVQLIQPDEEV